MRSEQVFRANERVANKFLLCQATARTTRRLGFASANTTDAITDAFIRIAMASHDVSPQLSPHYAPTPYRRVGQIAA